MRIIKITILLFFLQTLTVAQNGGDEWKKLTPLHTTRAEVEKIFGKPSVVETNSYDTANERISVWYSDGNCQQDKKAAWNVSKDTILSIIVSPYKTVSPESIFPNLSDFGKVKSIYNDKTFFYATKDNSIGIETRINDNKFEEVIFIMIKPSPDDKSLRCKP